MVYRFTDFVKERKESETYGGVVQDIMLTLRLYKTDKDLDEIKIKVSDIKTDYNKLNKLKKINYRNLVSFDFDFLDKSSNIVTELDKDGYIYFYNLNNGTKVNRPWESIDYIKNEGIYEDPNEMVSDNKNQFKVGDIVVVKDYDSLSQQENDILSPDEKYTIEEVIDEVFPGKGDIIRLNVGGKLRSFYMNDFKKVEDVNTQTEDYKLGDKVEFNDYGTIFKPDIIFTGTIIATLGHNNYTITDFYDRKHRGINKSHIIRKVELVEDGNTQTKDYKVGDKVRFNTLSKKNKEGYSSMITLDGTITSIKSGVYTIAAGSDTYNNIYKKHIVGKVELEKPTSTNKNQFKVGDTVELINNIALNPHEQEFLKPNTKYVIKFVENNGKAVRVKVGKYIISFYSDIFKKVSGESDGGSGYEFKKGDVVEVIDLTHLNQLERKVLNSQETFTIWDQPNEAEVTLFINNKMFKFGADRFRKIKKPIEPKENNGEQGVRDVEDIVSNLLEDTKEKKINWVYMKQNNNDDVYYGTKRLTTKKAIVFKFLIYEHDVENSEFMIYYNNGEHYISVGRHKILLYEELFDLYDYITKQLHK